MAFVSARLAKPKESLVHFYSNSLVLESLLGFFSPAKGATHCCFILSSSDCLFVPDLGCLHACHNCYYPVIETVAFTFFRRRIEASEHEVECSLKMTPVLLGNHGMSLICCHPSHGCLFVLRYPHVPCSALPSRATTLARTL